MEKHLWGSKRNGTCRIILKKLIKNRLYLTGEGERGNTVSKQNLERFFFHKMLQIKSPKVFFYFCSVKWNFDQFSLLRNALEQNFKSLLVSFVLRNGIPNYIFFQEMLRNKILKVCLYHLFHGTQFPAIFSSRKCFGTKFWKFASISVQR